MSTAAQKLITVQTRLDPDLVKRLDERRETEKRSRAFVLAEALEKHLAEDRDSSEKTGAAA